MITKDLMVIFFIAIFIALYLLGLLLIYFFHYKKKTKKHHQAELKLKQVNFEKKMLLLERENTNHKIENAKIQIDHFIKDIQEKTLIINNLKKEKPKTKAQFLADLEKTIILTDDDWNKFKNNFKKVYPNFISKIKTKYPDITSSEVRLLTLAKLNLSYKEMADLQGISTHAVRTTWYRFKNKLNLKNENINNFIEKI